MKANKYRARDPKIKPGLVLQRTVGEKILVGSGGDEVEITLMSTDGPVAEIHISAPRCVPVDRAERRRRWMP